LPGGEEPSLHFRAANQQYPCQSGDIRASPVLFPGHNLLQFQEIADSFLRFRRRENRRKFFGIEKGEFFHTKKQ